MTAARDRIHHDGSDLYVSAVTPSLDGTIQVSLRVPQELRPESVVLRTVSDGEPLVRPAELARLDGADGIWVANLRMDHELMHYRWLVSGGDAGYVWHTAAGNFAFDVNDATDFAISCHAGAPEWSREGVVYQIYPDRFAASGRQYPLPAWAVPRTWDMGPEGRSPSTPKEYFGGDLWGIIEQLDYLVELGVTTLYLTPFFPAGSTHRYDATTFASVDPLLGGDEALVALREAAHARDIRVIGDLTLNHTGVHHEWFTAALAGDPEYRDFYTFDESLPFGYACWLGVQSLPKLNYRSAALRRQVISGDRSVMRRWLLPPFELDGWRIDVGNMTARQGVFDANHEVAREAREAVESVGSDRLLVAEHFHDAGPDLAGDGWQGTMNYSAFMKPVWAWLRSDAFNGDWLGIPVRTPSFTGAAMVASIRSFSGRMPWSVWQSSWTILSSHDTARIRTVCGSRSRHLAAAVLLTTTPGVPMIFAGDELGAEGRWGEDSRTPHPWANEDNWDHDFLGAYRALIALRSASRALAYGGMRWVHVDDDVVVYMREDSEQRLLIAVAREAVGEVRLRASDWNIREVAPVFGYTAALDADELCIRVTDAGGGIWRVS